jgi:DNA-binding NarL/FixJ family response regulator
MQGQPVGAARLYGAASSLRTLLGAPLPPVERLSYQEYVAMLRAQLGEPAFGNAWAEGQALTLEEAIAEAGRVNARALPDRVDTPASASQAKPYGLTTREIEVLRLVKQGLTTSQIAEQLRISPRTADAHLRSIYGKLVVTSRAAATRSAIEHNLI